MAVLIFQFAPDRRVSMPFSSRVELAVHLAIQVHGGVGEAAKQIGVTRNVLFRWQQGTCPHRSNLAGLADAAGVPVEWLEPNLSRLAEQTSDEQEESDDTGRDPAVP